MYSVHSADIIYFSGTGCTAKVASALEKEFINNNIIANKHELKGKFQAESNGDLLIILFPVYAANAPKSIYEWVEAVSFGNGKKTAVISVSGGGEMVFNTACRLATIKNLIKKDYDVFYEEMFIMPTNCFSANSDTLNAMLLNVLPKKASDVVGQLITGGIHRKKPYILDKFISKAMIIERRMSKFFGKKLSANNNCTGCGLCAQNCPRNNIKMENGKPVFNNECVICLKYI
jgi:ferredoxin